ncbi:MAG: hypothetical protein CMJ83_16140 [Planctomycetes bacterium]|nr:hypothetical protein [Planctomycetota bacterium]
MAGNMGDALRKAGLISKQDLKKLDHQDRVRRKDGGRDGPDRERKHQNRPGRDRGQQRRDRDRVVERRRREGETSDEDLARAHDLVKSQATRAGVGGRRRWHYIAPDGKIPFLDVDEKLGRRLENGDAAIAFDGQGARVIDRDAAAKVDAIDPATVLYWNVP